MNYKIEAGKPSDIPTIENLYDDLNDYLEQTTNYPGWAKGLYPTRADAEDGIGEGNLFVLRIDDKIAGSVVLNNQQSEAYSQVTWGIEAKQHEVIVINKLAVHPQFLGQGVATKLLDFAKDYAIQQHAKAIRLDVTIQNAPAIALYEKCGYVYVGTVDLGLPYAYLKWFKLYELVI